MRAYRYLKNAERWVVVIGLFFLGVTFSSQNIGLTKVSICIFALAIFVRILLRAKMKSLFRKRPNQPVSIDGDEDFDFVFTWAVVTWSVFVASMSVLGFLYSLDIITLDGLRRSIWGLTGFVLTYTLITGVRYYKETDRLKKRGRKEITAAEFIDKENGKEQSKNSYLKKDK